MGQPRRLGGNNLFEGGFLGLDNIGPIDRSHLPTGGVLEQSDATRWIAFYAIAMAGIAAALHLGRGRPASDLALKFLEHVAAINAAVDKHSMWDDADGMYYHQLLPAGRPPEPVKVRSMVGIVPLLAVAIIDEELLGQVPHRGQEFRRIAASSGLPRG